MGRGMGSWGNGAHSKELDPILSTADSAGHDHGPICIELVLGLNPVAGVGDEIGGRFGDDGLPCCACESREGTGVRWDFRVGSLDARAGKR